MEFDSVQVVKIEVGSPCQGLLRVGDYVIQRGIATEVGFFLTVLSIRCPVSEHETDLHVLVECLNHTNRS